MNKSRLIIHILLILLLLMGCIPIRSSVIEDTICSSPCWKGIIPGKTNRREVISILNNLSEVESSSIRTMSVVFRDDSIYWDFKPKTGDLWARIFFKDDIVLAINFFPDKNGLPLDIAMEYLGEPENILAFYHHEEKPFINVFVGYPSKGVVLWMSINPYTIDTQANITGDIKVEGFWYFEPDMYIELMNSNYIAGVDSDILIEGLHPWTGYGDISEIVVDQQ